MRVYQAELNQSFPLMVAAVKKTHMIHGDTANIDELENLTAPIKEQATDMLNDQGLSIDDYVLFSGTSLAISAYFAERVCERD